MSEFNIKTLKTSKYNDISADLSNENLNIVRSDDETNKTTIPTVGFVIKKLNEQIYQAGDGLQLSESTLAVDYATAHNKLDRLTYVTYTDGTTSALNVVGLLTNTHIPNHISAISIAIGNSVTDIDSCAFNEHTNLTSVTIPDSVTSIGERAFANCKIRDVVLPNNLTTISNYTFYDTSLTSVTFGENINYIGSYAFAKTLMREVTLLESVMSISQNAFADCESLASVIVKGKTQAEAEALLSNASVPEGCTITTWNDASTEYVASQLSGYYDNTETSSAVQLNTALSLKLDGEIGHSTRIIPIGLYNAMNEEQVDVTDLFTEEGEFACGSFRFYATKDDDLYYVKCTVGDGPGKKIENITKGTSTSELNSNILIEYGDEARIYDDGDWDYICIAKNAIQQLPEHQMTVGESISARTNILMGNIYASLSGITAQSDLPTVATALKNLADICNK